MQCLTTVPLFLLFGLLNGLPSTRRQLTFYNDPVSWNFAVETCRNNGENLLTVDTVDVVTALVVSGFSSPFWTGLHNFNPGSADVDFAWSASCEPLGSYIPWDALDNEDKERCIRGKDTLKPDRLWETRDCSKKDGVPICEKYTGDCVFEEEPYRVNLVMMSSFHQVTIPTASATGCEDTCLTYAEPENQTECWGFKIPLCTLYVGKTYTEFIGILEGSISTMFLKNCIEVTSNPVALDGTQYGGTADKLPWKGCSAYATTTESTSTTEVSPTEESVTPTMPFTTTTTKFATTTTESGTTEYETITASAITTTEATSTSAELTTEEHISTTKQPVTTTTGSAITTTGSATTTTGSAIATTGSAITTTGSATTTTGSATTTTGSAITTTGSATTTTGSAITTTESAITTTGSAITSSDSMPLTTTESATTSTKSAITASVTISPESTTLTEPAPTTTKPVTASTESARTTELESTSTKATRTTESTTEAPTIENNTPSYKPEATTEKGTLEDLENCICDCLTLSNFTNAEKADFIRNILRNLTIDTQATSSERRKYTSATDPRPSAKYVGIAGIAILTLTFVSVFLLDLQALARDVRTLIRTIK